MCVCVCEHVRLCFLRLFFFWGGRASAFFMCVTLREQKKQSVVFVCLLSFVFFFLCVNFIDFCCCCFELLSGHLLFRLAFVFCVFLLFTYVLHTVPLKGNERQRKLFFFFFLVLVTDNLDAAPLKFGEYKRCWLPRRPCAGRPQALFRTLQNTRPSSFRENG